MWRYLLCRAEQKEKESAFTALLNTERTLNFTSTHMHGTIQNLSQSVREWVCTGSRSVRTRLAYKSLIIAWRSGGHICSNQRWWGEKASEGPCVCFLIYSSQSQTCSWPLNAHQVRFKWYRFCMICDTMVQFPKLLYIPEVFTSPCDHMFHKSVSTASLITNQLGMLKNNSYHDISVFYMAASIQRHQRCIFCCFVVAN